MQTSETRTRVVVCDDHPLFREGMVRVLRASGLDVIGEAADGRAALDTIRELSPDVAVVDYKMPGLDGVALVHAVTRDELPTKVLLVSAFDDSSIVYEALSSGALGYISKEAPPSRWWTRSAPSPAVKRSSRRSWPGVWPPRSVSAPRAT